jgi:hypothetical protein
MNFRSAERSYPTDGRSSIVKELYERVPVGARIYIE